MARLKHIKSGAVVEVREEKVALLGSEWEPVGVKKAPAKKASASKSEK